MLDRTGYTPAFLQTLRTSQRRVQESKIYILNPTAVLQVAAEGPVGRAAWRSHFDSGTGSDALDYGVDVHLALRGVRLVVAVGDAPEKGQVPYAASVPSEIPLADCYRTLLANPPASIQAMDDRVAGGLSRLVSDYLSTRR